MMNVIVASAAFIFGSSSHINLKEFVFMAFSLACVIGSACAFNNYFDRNIDKKMERTKNRAMVVGKVSPVGAIIFATALLVLGLSGLHYFTNLYALLFGLCGFVVYVFLYTPLKPRSAYALFVGAVAGAMPPLVGYTAAANRMDFYAWALFTFVFLWQIPHFLAIARYRFSEYRAAEVPLLVKEPKSNDEKRHARKIFRYSLVGLVVFCAVLILQRWTI